MTKRFLDPVFSAVLKKHKLEGFGSLWQHEGNLVEEGNVKRKSGSSHVVRLKLEDMPKTWTVYMKRQENYATSKSRFFSRPKAICAREFANIREWQKLGFPTMQALYFEQQEKPMRAILITKGLTNYEPLDEWLAKNKDLKLRKQVLSQLAQLICRIHKKGWVHQCFFPKHVFVRIQDGQIDLRMIDLEKAKKCLITKRRIVSELTAFIRRCHWQNDLEPLQFLKAYWGTKKFDLGHRRMLKLIEKRVAFKKARHS